MIVAVLLLLVACGIAAFGFVGTTAMTAGVGLIGIALLVAIMARIQQADLHHRRLRQEIARLAEMLEVAVESMPRQESASCPHCHKELLVGTLRQGENTCPHCGRKFVA